MAVGHEAEVADAHQTTWEHVQEKASDELVGVQGHRFESIATFAVAIEERDSIGFDGSDAVVGDRDSLGVASQVVQDRVAS